jgi:protocatechuate 3,4-dioxygenase beta subunit
MLVAAALVALGLLTLGPLRDVLFGAGGRDGAGSEDALGPGHDDAAVLVERDAAEGEGLALVGTGRTRPDPAAEAARLAALAAAQAAREAAELDARKVGWGGTLLDAQGRPVPGARLVLADATESLTLTTREDGTFDGLVLPGRYDLLITAPGRGSVYLEETLVEAGARLDLALTLAEPIRLLVRLQREGRAVEGARATLVLTRWRWEGKQAVLGQASDAEGRVEFAGLAAGTYELRVAVPQGPELVHTYELKQDLEVTATVPDAVELTGVITDAATQQPVAGAVVRVLTVAKGAPGFAVSAETQADGTYRLAVPKGQAREVSVSATGFAPWPSAREQQKALGRLGGLANAREPVVLSVPLSRGGAVRGLVTQHETKLPLPGVSLVFAEKRGSVRVTAVTDAEGRYVVEQLNPGTYEVRIASPGWFPEKPLELKLGGGRTEPLDYDVVLNGAAVLQGTVSMAQGATVKGARVWLTGGGQIARSARGAGRPLETFSDANGAWTITDVPPTATVVVRGQLGSLEATPIPVNLQRPPTHPLKLVLGGTVTLLGRVVDSGDGSAVPNARVQIVPKGAPWGRDGRTLTTDAQGAFRAEQLIAGEYDLTPRRGDYLAASARTLTLNADDPESRVELALDPGLVVAGRVTDEHGRALAGAVVADGNVDDPPGTVRRSQPLDADGRFRLTGFRPGTYRLRVTAQGYKTQTVEGLRGGENRLRFALVSTQPP